MDGMTFSGEAVSAVQGSGTFAMFTFTDHVPGGRFTLDNVTGPSVGGTLITVTLSAVVPQTSSVNYLVPFNWTKRVYLNDTGITLVNGTAAAPRVNDGDGGGVSPFYGVADVDDDASVAGVVRSDDPASDRPTQAMYEGVVYDIVYPVKEAAATAADADAAAASDVARETEAFFYGFSSERDETHGGGVSSQASANAVAAAAQAISYNTTGCSYATSAATMACLTSLDPYVLVTVGRAVAYTSRFSNTTPAPDYGRFEPSRLNACLFVVPDRHLTQVVSLGKNVTVYENQATPATWLGYNKIQCLSPPKTSTKSDTVSTSAVTVHVSNNGVDFSAEGSTFTYNDAPPTITSVFTVQEVAAFSARGPWSGNTEVYVIGANVHPSEHLTARFVTYDESNDGSFLRTGAKTSPACFYDSPTQIRCVSPAWFPDQYSIFSPGQLKPCFQANVEVSNDNGTTWSRFSMDAAFIYCPVCVSTYGSNNWGDGTPRLPYRDISRAIMATLSEPRAYFIRKGRGASGANALTGVEMTGRQHRGVQTRGRGFIDYINFDQILLMDGIYQDKSGVFGNEQNLHLSPHGRVIEIIAQNAGQAYIDCDGAIIDAVRPFDNDEQHEPDAEQHGSISFKDVGIVRCEGSVRWETYDYNWRVPTPTPVAPAPRTGRYVMERVCQMEPTFYGLQVPVGAVADEGFAGAGAKSQDGSSYAGVEEAAGTVGGDVDGASSLTPMVRVCREVARWEWDPDPAAGQGAGLGEGLGAEGGDSGDGDDSALGGAVLGGDGFYGLGNLEGGGGGGDAHGGGGAVVGSRRLLDRSGAGGAAGGDGRLGEVKQRRPPLPDGTSGGETNPPAGKSSGGRSTRTRETGAGTGGSEWWRDDDHRAGVGRGLRLPEGAARKVQEQLHLRDGDGGAAAAAARRGARAGDGRGTGASSPSRRRFQGSRG